MSEVTHSQLKDMGGEATPSRSGYDVMYWIHGLEVCKECMRHIQSHTIYETVIHATQHHIEEYVPCDWCRKPLHMYVPPFLKQSKEQR